MSKHQSGSPAEWAKRRAAYRAQSGAVSNPGDGRMRKAERRRLNAGARVAARELRQYLAAWDEAIALHPAESKRVYEAAWDAALLEQADRQAKEGA